MLKISVIIPTCDRLEHLRNAFTSVAQQDFEDIEIIIVNDGRQAIIDPSFSDEGIPVKFLQTPGLRGVSFARNLGSQAASAEWLAFLDDDDWWDSHFLKTLFKCAGSADADFVACGFWEVYEQGIQKPGKVPPLQLEPDDFILKNPGITGSNFLMKKILYQKIKGFDERLPTSNDKDFALRLISAGANYASIPDRLLYKNQLRMTRLTQISRRKMLGSIRFYNKYKQQISKKTRKLLLAKVYMQLFEYKLKVCHRFRPSFMLAAIHLDWKQSTKRLLRRSSI